MKRLANSLTMAAAVAALAAAVQMPSASTPQERRQRRKALEVGGYVEAPPAKLKSVGGTLRGGNNRKHSYRDDPKQRSRKAMAAASRKKNRSR